MSASERSVDANNRVAELLPEAVKCGRDDAWERAGELTRESSPWELEFFKASLGESEVSIGLAKLLAETSISHVVEFETDVHKTDYIDWRTLTYAMIRKGRKPWRRYLYQVSDRLKFLAGIVVALPLLVLYLIRHTGKPQRVPENAQQILAVHAEWTNRTRHVLGEIGSGLAPDVIIVIGRPQRRLSEVFQTWSENLGRPLPRIIVPVSFKTGLVASPEILRQLARGFQLVGKQPHIPELLEISAIVFRVMLGCVMRRWWLDCGYKGGEVVYGHTGTADTTMLELAQQERGTITTHIVHGLSTGPNFVGFSDKAFFRCGYDANLYANLDQYEACLWVNVEKPKVHRGKQGLVLMTNYAHPMNPEYRSRGLEDELRVLREVAKAASNAGSTGFPLRWKPHPVITALPSEQQERLRSEAAALGFEEINRDIALETLPMNARWFLTTPSTVAVDLLRSGTLAIVLDWQEQGAGYDTPSLQIPSRANNPDELVALLCRLDEDRVFGEFFDNAWNLIQPAGTMIPGETGHLVS